ncbi:hypothetical protein DPEC_G00360470 [Dallia pectoralis]|uniref:Uncharacterized protein n=1 Tax=Dallia pectoralis TaxID=75939 RepID=A0ACC2F0V9_DALPE|nr:hypothetical protein DPEC_G00360470 [Dallia pectoralis]
MHRKSLLSEVERVSPGADGDNDTKGRRPTSVGRRDAASAAGSRESAQPGRTNGEIKRVFLVNDHTCALKLAPHWAERRGKVSGSMPRSDKAPESLGGELSFRGPHSKNPRATVIPGEERAWRLSAFIYLILDAPLLLSPEILPKCAPKKKTQKGSFAVSITERTGPRFSPSSTITSFKTSWFRRGCIVPGLENSSDCSKVGMRTTSWEQARLGAKGKMEGMGEGYILGSN